MMQSFHQQSFALSLAAVESPSLSRKPQLPVSLVAVISDECYAPKGSCEETVHNGEILCV